MDQSRFPLISLYELRIPMFYLALSYIGVEMQANFNDIQLFEALQIVRKFLIQPCHASKHLMLEEKNPFTPNTSIAMYVHSGLVILEQSSFYDSF